MKFRRSLFWDADPEIIDQQKNSKYIIERVLDFGNDEEIRWLWKTYPRSLIEGVVKRSRVLREKSKSLWNLLIQ